MPGEFSRRGGILDVFSPDAEAPYRLEFFGDEVESIRQFAAETQRSLGDCEAVEITGRRAGRTTADGRRAAGHLADYLPAGPWVVLVEPDDLHEQGKHYLERVADPTGPVHRRGRLRAAAAAPERHASPPCRAPTRGGDVPPAGRVGRAVQRRRRPRSATSWTPSRPATAS